ncbi:transcriptional regulator [Enterococcus sp. JM4C]|uniref:PucR family transcriptional regulator n=1 Tax=Candidatus Enterococcus huntleyi TaxID=1857217 RepID=UPI00137A03BC|nr:PucR family transcriptional regulator [Enterococcus sp. JM4C]KAF1299232.1 transcriptional regulator [Enterococcus sp. JM4C]
MATLEEVLQVPRFSDLKILSTHEQQHEIVSVEITETPDIANYIPEETFILTTAMVFKNDQTNLKKLIASLKEKKCAGLGIKVGRFLGEIDPEIIAYGTALDLPIVEVPATQPLGQLLHKLLSYLWDSKTEQLTYALDIQKRFTNLLIHEVSNERFITDLGKIINAPTILLNPWKEVIAHSNHFSHSDRSVAYYTEQINEKHFRRIDRGKTSFLIQNTDEKMIQIAGFPIKIDTYFPYYLLVLNPEQIPFPTSEFAIDQAVLVLTFMLFKNQKIQESIERLRSDYLNQLITSQNYEKNEGRNWLDLGQPFGIKESHFYQMNIVTCFVHQEDATKLRYQAEKSQVAMSWLKEKLPQRVKDVLIFPIKESNDIGLLLQAPEQSLETIFEELSEELAQVLPIRLHFTLGNAYEALEEIANSFVEAKIAMEEVKQLKEPPIFQYYHAKGLFALFEQTNTEDIRYFCTKTLKDLAYPTEPSLIELRKTLKCYLDFNCEISKTATVLYLHRNTIKYRINQCEELLDSNIQNPQTSLNLRMAIELSESANQVSVDKK